MVCDLGWTGGCTFAGRRGCRGHYRGQGPTCRGRPQLHLPRTPRQGLTCHYPRPEDVEMPRMDARRNINGLQATEICVPLALGALDLPS